MTRHIDAYALERRATHVAFVLSLFVTRTAVLGWYRIGDARRRIGRAAR